ncbi:MAG: hypothetical protein FD160_1944, partial [Caulobacteraceae bacterium]
MNALTYSLLTLYAQATAPKTTTPGATPADPAASGAPPAPP